MSVRIWGTGGSGKKGYSIDPCFNCRIKPTMENIELYWSDPEDTIIQGNVAAQWLKTVVVRKTGGYPVDPYDGETICVNTVRNQYQTEPFIDNSAALDIVYYYSIFAFAENTISKDVTVHGERLICSIAYRGSDIIEPLSIPRQGIHAATIGNYAIFSGGRPTYYYGDDISTGYKTADAYNQSLTRTTAPSFAYQRYNPEACSNLSYAIFAGGQDTSNNGVSYVEAYSASLTRTTASSLYAGVFDHASAPIGNYAIFAGGRNAYGGTDYSYVYAYNNSLTRHSCSYLPSAVCFFAGTSNTKYAIFAGGYFNQGYSEQATAYNSSLTKTIAPNMQIHRLDPRAASTGNYAIFAGDRQSRSEIVDAYDTSLTRVNPDSMCCSRSYFSAASVNGYAIFAGGSTNPGYVDIYDSALTHYKLKSADRGRSCATSIGNYALIGGYIDGEQYNEDGSYGYRSIIDVYEYIEL